MLLVYDNGTKVGHLRPSTFRRLKKMVKLNSSYELDFDEVVLEILYFSKDSLLASVWLADKKKNTMDFLEQIEYVEGGQK